MAILINVSNTAAVYDIIENLALGYRNLIADKAFALIRDTTPIRTGRARRGWQKRASIGSGRFTVIENKVSYVIYLNEGHSRQAPKGYIGQQLERGIEAANREYELQKRFK